MASELLKVPVKIKILDCEYVSGFVGLSQDPNDSSLKPEIGCFISRVDDIVENARKKTTDDRMKQFGDQLKLRSIQ